MIHFNMFNVLGSYTTKQPEFTLPIASSYVLYSMHFCLPSLETLCLVPMQSSTTAIVACSTNSIITAIEKLHNRAMIAVE